MALPHLFPDYLKLESLNPIYYTSSPTSPPILHYWEARFLPRFLVEKTHSLANNYNPELAEIGASKAAPSEIALLGESVTLHFADGRVIGLHYHHLPVLQEKGTEEVRLYDALFQPVQGAENESETKDKTET